MTGRELLTKYPNAIGSLEEGFAKAGVDRIRL
jgi:hypothetical protein